MNVDFFWIVVCEEGLLLFLFIKVGIGSIEMYMFKGIVFFGVEWD